MTRRTAMAALAALSFVVIHHRPEREPLSMTMGALLGLRARQTQPSATQPLNAIGNVVLGSVNVNRATESQLLQVPGLKREYIRKIVALRKTRPLRDQSDLAFIPFSAPLRYLHFSGPSDIRIIRQHPLRRG